LVQRDTKSTKLGVEEVYETEEGGPLLYVEAKEKEISVRLRRVPSEVGRRQPV